MRVEPSPDSPYQALLAEVQALRQRVATLEQAKHDMEVMLEMATDHADDLSATLQQERDDLATMLDMTTDHADALEADLHSQAEALAQRSQLIRETFGRYVSEEVVTQLLDAPDGLELGGVKRQVTILLSDVRGFTALAECLDPQEVMRLLNHYLEAMLDVILAYQGTIIEILGDGLLVLFGAPIRRDDDAERAVACALAMQLRLTEVNTLHRHAGLPAVEMGIGVHTGDVVVGHIGSRQRTKYGVVGSAVNLTGRIESYTTGGQILISPSTYAETAALLTVSQQIAVHPKGITTPITLYAINGIGGIHALYLPQALEMLIPLPQRLGVRYTILHGKFTDGTLHAGWVVKLGSRAAELQLDRHVAAWSDLKLQFLSTHGGLVPGEICAKVVENLPIEAGRIIVHFTSLPEATARFLETTRKPTSDVVSST